MLELQANTGTCPATDAAAAGRQSATNRRWRAGETPVASPVGRHSLAHHACMQTAVEAWNPRAKIHALATTREIYHSLTREVSLLLPAPYHPITWTIPRKHTPHRNRTRQDPLVHIHREAPAEESDVTAALSSHQDSVQAIGSGAAHLARHSITGSFHRNDTKEDTVTSPSSSSPQILAREGEAESNLNGSHITRRSVLLVYTFCSQGWWTPPLQLGCAPTAPHHGRQELDYVVCMYLQRIEWVGLGHHRTTTGC